jgi:hypothetical protein
VRTLIDKIDPLLAVADSHEQAPDAEVNGGGPSGPETGTDEWVGHSPGRDGRGEHGRIAVARSQQ